MTKSELNEILKDYPDEGEILIFASGFHFPIEGAEVHETSKGILTVLSGGWEDLESTEAIY
jgi:hypothetical protein